VSNEGLPGHTPTPTPHRQAMLKDLVGLIIGTAIWAAVLRLPWMQAILEESPYLLWPLVPLVVLLSGLISMIAVRNRFLVADLAWVLGLLISSGAFTDGLFETGAATAIYTLLYTGAWYALLYAPLVMLGIWGVDRLRGQDA
jgi:hypothetical protein